MFQKAYLALKNILFHQYVQQQLNLRERVAWADFACGSIAG